MTQKQTSQDEYFSHLSGESTTEGQLSIDVLETDEEIVVRSAIAGVTREDLDITVTADTLTIRGERNTPQTKKTPISHITECYWGNFSRSIVLPATIHPKETEAELKSGILTIRLKKAEMTSHVPVVQKDDE